jgi:hypothetical protein
MRTRFCSRCKKEKCEEDFFWAYLPGCPDGTMHPMAECKLCVAKTVKLDGIESRWMDQAPRITKFSVLRGRQ